MVSDNFKKDIAARIHVIENASANTSFSELVKAAKLDPEKHFRYSNFSGADFSNSDLIGFDFTGANLENCRFDGSSIRGARFEAANLTGTNLHSARDWDVFLKNWKKPKTRPNSDHLRDFNRFQDAPFAPEMIKIPPGKFLMGSPEDEEKRRNNEGPQHEVSIDYPFAVSRFAVTFEEWDYYASQNSRAHKPKDEGWGRGMRPVINVSWEDAQVYVKWLREKTGQPYRLLTEAEWEYVARAGTKTPFCWGTEISTDQANYIGDYTYSQGSKGEYRQKTVPVDSFEANPWGLYNVHGNVWEWVEDRWHDNYSGAPTDGKAWIDTSSSNNEVVSRVVRGGSWSSLPLYLRSAFRSSFGPADRNFIIGFRLSRTL